MSTIRQASPESLIDRDRELLIAQLVAGKAGPKERARIEELSSARAALMKRARVQREVKRFRYGNKNYG